MKSPRKNRPIKNPSCWNTSTFLNLDFLNRHVNIPLGLIHPKVRPNKYLSWPTTTHPGQQNVSCLHTWLSHSLKLAARPWKSGAWKTILSFWEGLCFQGFCYVSFPENNLMETNITPPVWLNPPIGQWSICSTRCLGVHYSRSLNKTTGCWAHFPWWSCDSRLGGFNPFQKFTVCQIDLDHHPMHSDPHETSTYWILCNKGTTPCSIHHAMVGAEACSKMTKKAACTNPTKTSGSLW